MPKKKRNSGAKKRLRLTASGKIKRKHAYHRHILTKKSTKRKRALGNSTLVDKTDDPKMRNLISA